jgi:hypothetical protein
VCKIYRAIVEQNIISPSIAWQSFEDDGQLNLPGNLKLYLLYYISESRKNKAG